MAAKFFDDRSFRSWLCNTLDPITNRFCTASEGVGSAFSAWQITRGQLPFRGGHGFNQWLFRGFHDSGMVSLSVLRSGLDVLSPRGQAGIPVLLDAASPGSTPTGTSADGPWDSDGHSSIVFGMADFVTNRHGDVTNALFLDWSV